MLRYGGVIWVIWGKRKLESSGRFPNGGRIRIGSIKASKWKLWHLRLVLLSTESFMEKADDKQSENG